MGHGTACGDAVELVGDGTCRTLAAADKRGPGAGDGAVRALCPAGTKFQHGPSLGRPDDPAGLGGDQALVVDGQKGKCLDQLGLNGGSPDGDHRLPGENGSSFWNRPDVTGKMEIAQVLQKFLGEHLLFPEILDVLLIKMQVFDIVDQLIEPCADGKTALVGHVPEEHVEIRDPVLIPRFEVSIPHRQLIKVAEHRHIQLLFGFHITPQNLSASGAAFFHYSRHKWKSNRFSENPSNLCQFHANYGLTRLLSSPMMKTIGGRAAIGKDISPWM